MTSQVEPEKQDQRELLVLAGQREARSSAERRSLVTESRDQLRSFPAGPEPSS